MISMFSSKKGGNLFTVRVRDIQRGSLRKVAMVANAPLGEEAASKMGQFTELLGAAKSPAEVGDQGFAGVML